VKKSAVSRRGSHPCCLAITLSKLRDSSQLARCTNYQVSKIIADRVWISDLLTCWGRGCQTKTQEEVHHESCKSRKNPDRLPQRPFEKKCRQVLPSPHWSVLSGFWRCRAWMDFFRSDPVIFKPRFQLQQAVHQTRSLSPPVVIFQFHPQPHRPELRQSL
jgi:hypothetical protein